MTYIDVDTDIMCIYIYIYLCGCRYRYVCIHLSIFRYTWGNIKERIISNIYKALIMCWVLSQHFMHINSCNPHDKSMKEI